MNEYDDQNTDRFGYDTFTFRLYGWLAKFTTRPSYMPHYASWPSVRPSVSPFLSHGLLTRKQKKSTKTQNWRGLFTI